MGGLLEIMWHISNSFRGREASISYIRMKWKWIMDLKKGWASAEYECWTRFYNVAPGLLSYFRFTFFFSFPFLTRDYNNLHIRCERFCCCCSVVVALLHHALAPRTIFILRKPRNIAITSNSKCTPSFV